MNLHFSTQGQWLDIYHKQSFGRDLSTTFLLAWVLWLTEVALNLKRFRVPDAATFLMITSRTSSGSCSIYSKDVCL